MVCLQLGVVWTCELWGGRCVCVTGCRHARFSSCGKQFRAGPIVLCLSRATLWGNVGTCCPQHPTASQGIPSSQPAGHSNLGPVLNLGDFQVGLHRWCQGRDRELNFVESSRLGTWASERLPQGKPELVRLGPREQRRLRPLALLPPQTLEGLRGSQACRSHFRIQALESALIPRC